ncbi:MAG: DCC1-like thiol-disulfide oxidoreductase family protein [Pseudomonadales bacterium]
MEHLPSTGRGASVQPGTSRPGWLTPAREIFAIDLRTMALFRVLLGAFLILDLILRTRDLTAHYTDFGVMPRAAALDSLSISSFSVHLMNGSAPFQLFLFAVAALFALMLVVGWRTRLATVVSWALLLSLQNRNIEILSGEDNLVMLLTFWAMFLPLGARYSVDAALSRNAHPGPNSYFSVATIALLLQGMYVYFFSALLKSDSRWFPDGTAVYYALQLDYFVKPFSLWLREFEPLLEVLTHYVYALELIGPILIFSPICFLLLRSTMMIAFITMHIGFFMCLEIGAFPIIAIIMNLAFLPSQAWDCLAAKVSSSARSGLAIFYDGDCDFCLKTCRMLRLFLFLGDVPIRPAQEDPPSAALMQAHNSWVVTDQGKPYLKWNAMRLLFERSPMFWPLAKLMALRPLRFVGDRSYEWIGAHRSQLSAITSRVLPWRTPTQRSTFVANALAMVMLVFVTVQNLSTLPALGFEPARGFVVVRQFLGVYQNWNMFAPHPELVSPWPVIEGRLLEGTVVDVYNHAEKPADFRKPDVVSAVYRNYRWRKYLSNLEDQSYRNEPQRLASNYARYLCRKWNSNRLGNERLASFDIVFNVERTPPPREQKVVESRRVWSHNCLGVRRAIMRTSEN